MSSIINLDFAAGTPVDKKVAKLVYDTMLEHPENPSAVYSAGREAKRLLAEARAQAARAIGARPSEIIFTAGGTESANLGIQGVMRAFSDSHLLVSAIEHEAVNEPAQLFQCDTIPVNQQGIIKVDKLVELIRDNTVLVSVMYANNEVGTIQPLKEVVEAVRKVRLERKKTGNKLPLYVHTDACQAGQFLDCQVSRLGIDMMTLNGGKLYGPKQSGVLYVRTGTRIQPLIRGGGQEFGLRSGTENLANARGFALALEQSILSRADTARTVQQLSHYFIKELEGRFQARLNGHVKQRIPNNIHVTFSGKDNERILFALDQFGVQASAGSACQASKDIPSRVLRAMGMSDDEAQASIRFSLGKTTTKKQIDRALDCLQKALEM